MRCRQRYRVSLAEEKDILLASRQNGQEPRDVIQSDMGMESFDAPASVSSTSQLDVSRSFRFQISAYSRLPVYRAALSDPIKHLQQKPLDKSLGI